MAQLKLPKHEFPSAFPAASIHTPSEDIQALEVRIDDETRDREYAPMDANMCAQKQTMEKETDPVEKLLELEAHLRDSAHQTQMRQLDIAEHFYKRFGKLCTDERNLYEDARKTILTEIDTQKKEYECCVESVVTYIKSKELIIEKEELMKIISGHIPASEHQEAKNRLDFLEEELRKLTEHMFKLPNPIDSDPDLRELLDEMIAIRTAWELPTPAFEDPQDLINFLIKPPTTSEILNEIRSRMRSWARTSSSGLQNIWLHKLQYDWTHLQSKGEDKVRDRKKFIEHRYGSQASTALLFDANVMTPIAWAFGYATYRILWVLLNLLNFTEKSSPLWKNASHLEMLAFAKAASMRLKNNEKTEKTISIAGTPMHLNSLLRAALPSQEIPDRGTTNLWCNEDFESVRWSMLYVDMTDDQQVVAWILDHDQATRCLGFFFFAASACAQLRYNNYDNYWNFNAPLPNEFYHISTWLGFPRRTVAGNVPHLAFMVGANNSLPLTFYDSRDDETRRVEKSRHLLYEDENASRWFRAETWNAEITKHAQESTAGSLSQGSAKRPCLATSSLLLY